MPFLAPAVALSCAGPCVQPLTATTSPAALATRSTSALRGLRQGRSGPDAVALQLAVRELVVTPTKVQPTLARLAPADRTVVARLVDAGTSLRSMTAPKPSLPNWRIVTPPAPSLLRPTFQSAGKATGIPWTTLAAVMLVETRMGRIRGASDAGALGPMQFLPATWRQYGRGSIDSYPDSIRAAGRYLAASGGAADLNRALHAYNHDQRYVRAVRTYDDLMRTSPWLYAALSDWRVIYRLRDGAVLLNAGYRRR
jgi:hypothetical protein